MKTTKKTTCPACGKEAWESELDYYLGICKSCHDKEGAIIEAKMREARKHFVRTYPDNNGETY